MDNMKTSAIEFKYGKHTVKLETGRIARQAAGSVWVTVGKTSVLAAVTADKKAGHFDFTPLTVHYQERYYAAGRIPGSFFRRESRPTEKETLTSRLIDRPLRPLFEKGYRHETLVMCTVMSLEEGMDADIPAMIGAFAAMALAGLPCLGPVGAVRVGLSAEEGYLLNPDSEELSTSDLNMVVSGTKDAILMVESEASELSEDVMLGAVLFAHQEMQVAIDAIGELVKKAGATPWKWEKPAVDEELHKKIADQYGEQIESVYATTEDRAQQSEQLEALVAKAQQELGEDWSEQEIAEYFKRQKTSSIRQRLLSGGKRIDGRSLTCVRPIQCEINLLPSAHGSALFTRGSTQALGTVTLGTKRSAQMLDDLGGKDNDTFMLHYNFPPYCVGESGRVGPPGRREIGHGRLARRAVTALLPDQEEFPYTLRIVSEITESNGSSSMATVCASSLAMMSAGVPIKAAVAGVAMGLIKESDNFVVLTDILGDEDHLGDMDFKVAGTASGITALQMDIKIDGITEDVMKQALTQAQAAREHILGEMNKIIDKPTSTVSDTAPGFELLHIPVAKIRDLIGKGGETIRQMTLETGTDIDVEQDGTVRIYGENRIGLRDAVNRVEALTAVPELGKIYDGKVVRIAEYGAFVNFLPGKDGLVHISQIADKRIRSVGEYLSDNQQVRVKVIGIDEMGRVRLSIKEAMAEEASEASDE